jgi:hypothetical protein
MAFARGLRWKIRIIENGKLYLSIYIAAAPKQKVAVRMTE